MEPLDAIYRHGPTLALRRLGDEAVAITTHDSRVHELNETAAAILLACEQPLTGHAVLASIRLRFDVSPEVASGEVAAFLATLVDAGLLAREG